MEETQQPVQRLHLVGKKDELIEAGRSFRTLEGRDVLIVHHQGVFYALDCYCYHAGSTLQNGDIEDINGKLCIICPKHKYKITLAEGEGLYKGRNPMEKPPVFRWYSKGIKQRVHVVTEANGEVYVQISTEPRQVDSDYYQGAKGKVERERAAAADDGMPVMEEDE